MCLLKIKKLENTELTKLWSMVSKMSKTQHNTTWHPQCSSVCQWLKEEPKTVCPIKIIKNV